MYQFLNSKIFPVVGDERNIQITTKAFYEENNPWLNSKGIAGEPHGQSRGGLGVDLGTSGNSYPVVTTQYEIVLAQAGTYSIGGDGGLGFTTYSDLFQQRYLHMQNGTIAQSFMSGLISSASNINLNRFTLPPGYQFGNVGNTGLSSNKHLHYELNPYRRR